MAERRPNPRSRGLHGGYPGNDAQLHGREAAPVALILLEHGCGHREDTGVAGGDDRDARSGRRQLERMAGPLGLNAVIARVTALTRAWWNALEVGPVADELLGLAQRGARLGREPLRPGGAEADDGQLPRPTPPPWRGRRGTGTVAGARHEQQRHVRHLALDGLKRRHALALGGGALDIDRPRGRACARGCPAHVLKAASELDHDRRLALAQPLLQRGGIERPREDRKHIVALGERRSGGRGGAEGRHPRHDLDLVAGSKPLVQVHVGAVEERVALAQHGHVAPRVKVRGDRRRGALVEVVQRPLVPTWMLALLGRHGIAERKLKLLGADVGRGGSTSDAATVASGQVGDHSRLLDRAPALDCDQLRIAGTDADANQPTRARPDHRRSAAAAHSASHASALTAAEAIALPPRRPRTTRNSHAPEPASASLLSAAPTKPTGTPITAAGRGAPAASSSSRRKRAVGALPIAISAPPSRSRHSSTAAAVRVVRSSRASGPTRASCNMHSTSLLAGRRARVTPAATISVSHRIGAPPRSAAWARSPKLGEATMSRARSTIPQAWIMRTATRSRIGSKPPSCASARMIANERR